MVDKFPAIFNAPPNPHVTESELIGNVCRLLYSIRIERSSAWIFEQVYVPLRQENIKFYFDSNGTLAAFATWAYLDSRAERRIARTGSLKLAPDDWNSGPSPWIIDLFAQRGILDEVLDDLRDCIFKDVSQLRFARSNRGSFRIKQVARSQVSHFFKKKKKRDGTCACNSPDCSLQKRKQLLIT